MNIRDNYPKYYEFAPRFSHNKKKPDKISLIFSSEVTWTVPDLEHLLCFSWVSWAEPPDFLLVLICFTVKLDLWIKRIFSDSISKCSFGSMVGFKQVRKSASHNCVVIVLCCVVCDVSVLMQSILLWVLDKIRSWVTGCVARQRAWLPDQHFLEESWAAEDRSRCGAELSSRTLKVSCLSIVFIKCSVEKQTNVGNIWSDGSGRSRRL